MHSTRNLSVIHGRFWRKVEKTDDCWMWKSCVNGKGYGRFRDPLSESNQKRVLSHRYAWEMANGPIPAGMLVLHKCDNPACVRPDHLFLGTHTDNALDCIKKGRHQAQTKPEVYLRGEDLSRRLRGKKMPLPMIGKKITREIAYAIRESTEPATVIAERFSIHWSHVYKIRRGAHWIP